MCAAHGLVPWPVGAANSNRHTKTCKAVLALKAAFRWALTGEDTYHTKQGMNW
jgi:hypothetical protein